MDTILFNMLILGGLCDTQGRVWRRDPSDICAVEITLLEEVRSVEMNEMTLLLDLVEKEMNEMTLLLE